jgi:hypothetical protein
MLHQCSKVLLNVYLCPPLQAKRAASAEGTDIPAIPITVRQLEAVIRIAESLAKMQLQVGRPSWLAASRCHWAWPLGGRRPGGQAGS